MIPKRPRRRRNIIRVTVYKDEDGKIKADIDIRCKFTNDEKQIAARRLLLSVLTAGENLDLDSSIISQLLAFENHREELRKSVKS